jgi:hypothetical protein
MENIPHLWGLGVEKNTPYSSSLEKKQLPNQYK